MEAFMDVMEAFAEVMEAFTEVNSTEAFMEASVEASMEDMARVRVRFLPWKFP